MNKSTKPYMKDAEWKFLKSYLNKNQIMLEYGSGNSTMCIAPLVKNLWSIEHDKKWFDQVTNMISNLDNVRLFYVPQDLTRSNPTKYEEFKTYVNWINDKDIKFDIVLIDGRARQWCAETVMPKLKENHLVFLHDYNLNERPYYQRVQKFYKIVDKSYSMVAMVKK